MLDRLDVPIVQAPLAGGASTPELAAAVSGAGGLGFIADGYRTPDALADDVARTRELTDRPVRVKVFAPTRGPASPATPPAPPPPPAPTLCPAPPPRCARSRRRPARSSASRASTTTRSPRR